MSISERLTELTDAGCLIRVERAGIFLHPARFHLTPKTLIWVNVFPDSQHDVHALVYDDIELIAGGRDIALTIDGEKLGAYIAPLSEWEGYPEAEKARDELPRWREHLTKDGGKELDRFFTQEIQSILGDNE